MGSSCSHNADGKPCGEELCFGADPGEQPLDVVCEVKAAELSESSKGLANTGADSPHSSISPPQSPLKPHSPFGDGTIEPATQTLGGSLSRRQQSTERREGLLRRRRRSLHRQSTHM